MRRSRLRSDEGSLTDEPGRRRCGAGRHSDMLTQNMKSGVYEPYFSLARSSESDGFR
ncbi:20S proteasome [Pseudomonas syringae pv. actinidiae]|uniref:20S proteasome n=1 Tax=Pseudomonas syringae pv. actinidiae TaxID=103796 RepID=A0A2V0QD70_PSESF|nr:20S proteasome [Pseudomonas syringae pv. actinidiae]